MLNKLERDTMANLRATCFNLEKDLAHQRKLVRVLAEKLHEWDETPNKNESPFDFLAYAEAKVAEEEKQTSPTGAERKS